MLIFCAARPAINPDSTSPDPAVASPEFPVLLIYPLSLFTIMLEGYFATKVPLKSFIKSAIEFGKELIIFTDDKSKTLDNSPIWGVIAKSELILPNKDLSP